MASHTDVEGEGEEDGIFQVHCILSASLESVGTGPGGEDLTSWYYKIRWFGYTAEADTYEPEAHLECPKLLRDFWKHVGGKHLKSGKHETEYTASPAWIQRQLEHFTEAGKQKEEKPKRKQKSQKPEKEKKTSNKPPKRKTPSYTKVDTSSPDIIVIESDSSKSPTDLFDLELSSSDSLPVVAIRSPSPSIPKSAGRKRRRVIVDESSEDGDDNVPLATLSTHLRKKSRKAGSSAPGSVDSHTHSGQTSARASASADLPTGSRSSSVPAMAQLPEKALDQESTSDVGIVPSMLDGKMGDARKETAEPDVQVPAPVKVISGSGLGKTAPSTTSTTTTESGDTGRRRPSGISPSLVGPPKPQVSPQRSSTQKLGFTENPKRKTSMVFQTSAAKITDKHRGARVMMVDGLQALPPERPYINKSIYRKIVKKLPKTNTPIASSAVIPPPPKLPKFNRLPTEQQTPANTQAPSQSTTTDNDVSGWGDIPSNITWGATDGQPVVLENTSGWGPAEVQPPASNNTSGWGEATSSAGWGSANIQPPVSNNTPGWGGATASSGWGSVDIPDPPQTSIATSGWGLDAQAPIPSMFPEEPSGWSSTVEGGWGDPSVLTDEPSSMCSIGVVDKSSVATVQVDRNNVVVGANVGHAGVLNTSVASPADGTNLGPWVGDLELRLAGGSAATLRASLTSASSTGTLNPLVPLDILRPQSKITFERTYSIKDYVNLIKPAYGPVREFAMVEDPDSDDKNRKRIENLAAYLEDTNQIAIGFIKTSEAVLHRCIVIIAPFDSDQLDLILNASIFTGLKSSPLFLALIPQVYDQQLHIDLHPSLSGNHSITSDSSHDTSPADRFESQAQVSTSPSLSTRPRLKSWPEPDIGQYFLAYRHTIAHLQLTDADMEFLYQKDYAMFPDEDKPQMDVETRAVFNFMTRFLKAKRVSLVDMNAKVVLIHRKSILDLANLPKLHERRRDFPDFVFYTYGWGPYRQDARGSKLRIAFQMGGIMTLTPRVIVNHPIAVERLAKYVEEHPFWELYISPATLALAYVLATSDNFNPNGPKSTFCASVVLHLARHVMNPISELGHIHTLSTKLRLGANKDAAEGAHITPETWGLEQQLISKADPFDLVDQSMSSIIGKAIQLLEAAAAATASAGTPSPSTARGLAPAANINTGWGSTPAYGWGTSTTPEGEWGNTSYKAKGKGKVNSQDRATQDPGGSGWGGVPASTSWGDMSSIGGWGDTSSMDGWGSMDSTSGGWGAPSDKSSGRGGKIADELVWGQATMTATDPGGWGASDLNPSIPLKDETPESLLAQLSQQMRVELERHVEDEIVGNLKAFQLQPTLQEDYRRFVLVSDTGTGVGSITGPQAVEFAAIDSLLLEFASSPLFSKDF
ncbi:hypothetical protein FRB94_000886 [Tulasnella sp. JGI-2019a]|nr:hypothetical protein FRB94_000886 [Tulasnella sp. JGI-2019a]